MTHSLSVRQPAGAPTGPEPELRTVTMIVTPEQAREWLDRMPTQRRIRRTKMDQLRRTVLGGASATRAVP
jgi:hypothetical protein